MPFSFPHVVIGKPLAHTEITAFPLRVAVEGGVDYVLSSEARARGQAQVSEVDVNGNVSELTVCNRSVHRLLVVKGECQTGSYL